MDISNKLLVIAMITYAALFVGFIIAGIGFDIFRSRHKKQKPENNGKGH